MRAIPSSLGAAAVLLASACSLTPTDTSEEQPLLSAFETAPYGMSNVMTSFGVSSDQEGTPWAPPGRPGHEFGPRGTRGGPMGFIMGGLHGGFIGNAFGVGFGHRPPNEADASANCAFNSTTGRVECQPVDRNGLTIVRSAQFLDGDGNVQSSFNNQTTNTVNTQISVTGTVTRRSGSTSEVDAESDRTVSGLAQGSTQRTINGTARGHEVITGTDRTGDFVADRLAEETIDNVVIPVPGGGQPAFPISGTITRSMTVTVTYAGSDPVTSTRLEVITFNGTDGATIEITHNGQTRTCTLSLPRARPNCS